MTRTPCRVIGLALVATMWISTVGAQESNQPRATFFAPLDVPLVSVEVYVTDRAGRPIPGLALDDFEVSEDGKPVSISHFYASPGVTESVERSEGSGAETTESAPGQNLYLVIFFDDTNLNRGRRQSAIEHLRSFLTSELPSDLKVMLVRYDGHLNIEQSFTDDTDAVARALDAVEGSASLSRRLDEDRLLREMQNTTTSAAMGGGGTVLETSGASILQDIDSYVNQTVQRIRAGLGDQRRLIRSLSGLAGRKALLLVSDGVEVRPGEYLYRKWGEIFASVPEFKVDAQRAFLMAARNDLGNDFDDLARFANGRRVSYYNLSAIGAARMRAASAETQFMDEGGFAIDQGMSEDVNLAHISGATGGRALVNSPALSGQLDEVSVELASYYSLAFEPRHAGDGAYHRLQVKVKRDGVRARYREGYLDVPLSERMTDRTLAAAVYGIGDNPLGITLSNGDVTARDDGTYLVPIIITVPISQLVLIPSEEEHRGRISILLTVRDQRGDLSPLQRREYPVPVRNADLTAALGQRAGFTLRLAVRPGRQRIAVGVRDEVASTESVAILEVDVGDTGDAADRLG